MIVGKVLVTPCQNLLTGVGVGGIAPDTEMNSGETRKRKSGGRHCWCSWVIGEKADEECSLLPMSLICHPDIWSVH